MKRLFVIGATLAILSLAIMPVVVIGDSCCDYAEGSCCRKQCCNDRIEWYRVSYFVRVPTGYFNQGVEMTRGVWTHEYIQAHDHKASAEEVGMVAGHGCFVNAQTAVK